MRTKLDHVRANVPDLRRAVAWYQDTLGFEVESYWPPDDPNYAHFKAAGGATFAVGGGRLRRSVQLHGRRPRRAVGASEGQRHGRRVPLRHPYGTRKFTIADPDGNELGFVRDG